MHFFCPNFLGVTSYTFFFLAWRTYPTTHPRNTTNLSITHISELQLVYLFWKDRFPAKSPFWSDERKIYRTQSTDCASLTKTVNERRGQIILFIRKIGKKTDDVTKLNLWNYGIGWHIQKEQEEKCSLAKNQPMLQWLHINLSNKGLDRKRFDPSQF